MTQDEYKAIEMERMAKMNAAPLANQVFKPVQVTNVPPPPRPQEPQITPQQRQPNIAQQFGQAFATAGIDKGVNMAMKALPFARGDKVGEYEGMEDTPDDYNHLDEFYDPNNRFFPPMQQIKKVGPLVNRDRPWEDKVPWWKQDIPDPSEFIYEDPLEEEAENFSDEFADGRRQYRRLSGQERKDLMNTQPDDLSTPETFVYPTSEEGWDQWAKNRPDPRPGPPIIRDPMGPRRPGPTVPWKVGPLAQALPPGIDSRSMQILQFYGVDPFKASIEDAENYGNLYEHQYGDMEFHPLMNMNRGGDVTYAQTGRLASVRAPLAKPAAIDKGTPGLTHPRGTTHGEYWKDGNQFIKMGPSIWPQGMWSEMKKQWNEGAPGLTHPAGTTRDEYWKDGNQFIKMDTSPNRESWWQKAERTGLFGVPGAKDVYFDPGKGTVAYQKEGIRPFTWMWNQGRDFLGFGAPLAGGSE